MNSRRGVFFLASLGVFGNIYAENPKQQLLERPNTIYFGPEFLCFQVHTDVESVELEETKFFWGLRLGDQHLKSKAFYASVELVATNTAHDFSYTYNGTEYSKQGSAGFGNLGTRFGYTFPISKQLLTPYLGLGVYSLSKRCHSGFKECLAYLSGGVRSLFEWNSILKLGLNAEIY